MTLSSMSPIRRRLGFLAAHLVVALVALVVIGGATRVMEAGLACPDWPLCFGTLLPGRQMNVQVFLEWFHRLDAFVVGVALLVMAIVAVLRRRQLPAWLPALAMGLVLLVALQGGLGALTVLDLLPSGIVTAHLAMALTLVALLSGLTQRLLHPGAEVAPAWWSPLAGSALLAVVAQSLLGGSDGNLLGRSALSCRGGRLPLADPPPQCRCAHRRPRAVLRVHSASGGWMESPAVAVSDSFGNSCDLSGGSWSRDAAARPVAASGHCRPSARGSADGGTARLASGASS